MSQYSCGQNSVDKYRVLLRKGQHKEIVIQVHMLTIWLHIKRWEYSLLQIQILFRWVKQTLYFHMHGPQSPDSFMFPLPLDSCVEFGQLDSYIHTVDLDMIHTQQKCEQQRVPLMPSEDWWTHTRQPLELSGMSKLEPWEGSNLPPKKCQSDIWEWCIMRRETLMPSQQNLSQNLYLVCSKPLNSVSFTVNNKQWACTQDLHNSQKNPLSRQFRPFGRIMTSQAK